MSTLLENAMNTGGAEIIPEELAWIDDGSTTPEALLHVVDPDGSELLLVSTDGVIKIGISDAVPRTPIHIVVGRDEFTDVDIREWAKGNLKSIDWAAGQWTFIIEYLSQIIVSQVLGETTQ